MNVKAQHMRSEEMDGTKPDAAVSAGKASMPAPIAVPAKSSDAPKTLPSSSSTAVLASSDVA
jgi:hypothetical protein